MNPMISKATSIDLLVETQTSKPLPPYPIPVVTTVGSLVSGAEVPS